MARPKKIPKRLPPVTKELVKTLTILQNLIPAIAKFERSSMAIDMARQALDFELEPITKERKKKEQAIVPATESQAVLLSSEPVPGPPAEDAPGPAVEQEPIPGQAEPIKPPAFHACEICAYEGNPDKCQPGEGLIVENDLVKDCPAFVLKSDSSKKRSKKKKDK